MICDLPLTRHAEARSRQRAVPPLVIDWLLTHGTRTQAGAGAELLFFDKRALRQLEKTAGASIVARLSDVVRGTYAIVGGDGSVITIGHRYARIERDFARCRRRRKGE